MQPVYTPDDSLSESADVLLEHALVALSVEERFVIARRVANNLGYEIQRRRPMSPRVSIGGKL